MSVCHNGNLLFRMQRPDEAPQNSCPCLLLQGILSGKRVVIMLNDQHFSCSRLRNSYHRICLLYMLYGRVFSWQPFWLSVLCCWSDTSSCACWTLSVHSPAVIADFQFDNVKICTLVCVSFFLNERSKQKNTNVNNSRLQCIRIKRACILKSFVKAQNQILFVYSGFYSEVCLFCCIAVLLENVFILYIEKWD